MSKRKYAFDAKKTERYIRQGRGAGHGKHYQSWLRIQDLPSKGISVRDKGWTAERVHEYLSRPEWRYFLFLEFAECVTDIREQFPLDLDRTQAIAERLGIKHPVDPHSKDPIVMTTDFVIDITDAAGKWRQIARTVKQAEALNDLRVIEKLQIERAYMQEANIDWGIVTQEEVSGVSCENIGWLLPRFSIALCENIRGAKETVFGHIKRELHADPALSIAGYCARVDLYFNLESGTSLQLMRHLLARKEIHFDIRQKLSGDTAVGSLHLPAAYARQSRKAG